MPSSAFKNAKRWLAEFNRSGGAWLTRNLFVTPRIVLLTPPVLVLERILYRELGYFGTTAEKCSALDSALRRLSVSVQLAFRGCPAVVFGTAALYFVVSALRYHTAAVAVTLAFVVGCICYGYGLWFPVVFLFPGPIRRSLREQASKLGVPICVRCGYDLHGNLSGRCPECGLPTEADPARSAEKPGRSRSANHSGPAR